MIRRIGLAVVAVTASIVTLRIVLGRGADRLLAGERTSPDEATLGPSLDALGGEVVRFRSRDGTPLAGRWLPASAEEPAGDVDDWRPDPHDAIVALHGWSGSAAPDLVEYGPFLRRTAGVFGVDFGGHGGSAPAPTTFGMREIEDVAGALSWLGARGVERVALVGWSMGGITAIAAVAVLGDGTLASADVDAAAAAHVPPAPRPLIVAVVADSVTPELVVAIGSRLPGPARRLLAGRLLDAAARKLGGDPRETEPRRVVGLLEGTPLLLISGDADATVPIEDARRLADSAPVGTRHLVVPGADHTRAHATAPAVYEEAVTGHLRAAFARAAHAPIIHGSGTPSSDTPRPASPAED